MVFLCNKAKTVLNGQKVPDNFWNFVMQINYKPVKTTLVFITREAKSVDAALTYPACLQQACALNACITKSHAYPIVVCVLFLLLCISNS